jgi:hypothetical protein
MSINSYDGSTSALLKSPGRPARSTGNDPSTPLLDKGEASHTSDRADIAIATLNLIKAVVGAGVLALPYAFSHGGLILSSIGMAVIAIWNYFTVSLLLKCKVPHDLNHFLLNN